MHIEPGIVQGAKLILSYGTAAGAFVFTAKCALEAMRGFGLPAFVLRTVIATLMTFVFFEVLPHYPVGVSEVHFILGSTLFLLFGAGAASLGLAAGLLLQGALFAPSDLPQYFINATTLLVPMFAVQAVARTVIPAQTAYVDLKYADVLKLSAIYQSGVIAWVAFWAFYGQGFGAENLAQVLSFGAAYALVILIEPLVDLAVLGAAKAGRDLGGRKLFQTRLYLGRA